MNAAESGSSGEPAIAALGEALIDIFPDREVIGGAPFNVACNIAALGGRAMVASRIGDDPRGERIAVEARRLGIDPRGLQRDATSPTGWVDVRILQDGGHRFEIPADQAWDRLDARALTEALEALQPAAIYFGTLAQRAPVSRAAIRGALAATQALRFLDLNLRDGPDDQRLAAESLALAQVVKINDDELERLAGWFVPGAQAGPEAAAEALVQRFGLRRLVVTRGESGWACCDAKAGHWLRGASPRVALRDTVGAGDAFASVLLLGTLRRWPLELCLRRASAFAAAVCTIRGAFDADAGIYAASLAAWSSTEGGTG